MMRDTRDNMIDAQQREIIALRAELAKRDAPPDTELAKLVGWSRAKYLIKQGFMRSWRRLPYQSSAFVFLGLPTWMLAEWCARHSALGLGPIFWHVWCLWNTMEFAFSRGCKLRERRYDV